MKPLPVILMLALAAVAIPSAAADVAGPCTVNSSNDTVCHVGAVGCSVDHYGYDVEDALNRYSAVCWGCGYDTWASPALRTDCFAVASPTPLVASAAAPDPEFPCQDGIAQTWCDVSAGPCDVRVVPWTAWGDQYVVSDCRVGGGAGMTCHTEVHTQSLTDPQHWCAV